MEIIIIIVVVAIVWFFGSGHYKIKIQDPETLRPHEIEETIVSLKKQILVTSAYDKEAEYRSLYNRLNDLMGQVMVRHRHYILDVEALGSLPVGFFRPMVHHDSNGLQYITYSVSYDLELSLHSPEVLIYACFFLWHGGQAKNIGVIDPNPELMMKIINFLANEKKYGPAIFMKGMISKYGARVYSESFPAEARLFLLQAQELGVGSAAIELEYLAIYTQLAGIKGVHFHKNY